MEDHDIQSDRALSQTLFRLALTQNTDGQHTMLLILAENLDQRPCMSSTIRPEKERDALLRFSSNFHSPEQMTG